MGKRRFDSSRSPPSQPRVYPRNRRSRSPRFSDFRSSRDAKSTSYCDSFSRRRIITWSRSYYGRDDHEHPQCSRPRFDYESRDFDRGPAPSNFYNYSRIDDDYDDYRRSRRPPSPRRPRYSSGSSDLKYGKNPTHGGSRHCDRESSPRRYRRPDSSCDYNNEGPRRWWSDRLNEQRWQRRQRKSISPPRFNYHNRPPLSSYNYSSHRQYYYDDYEEHYPRSNNRPLSPPRHRHGHGSGFPPPGPCHNQNQIQNHGRAGPNYHPSSPGHAFMIPDQTNIDNNTATPEAVLSPCYSPDAPGSCTPIMESTPEQVPDRTPPGSPPIEQFQWGWLQKK